MSIDLSPKQLKRLERAFKIEEGILAPVLESIDELEDKLEDLTGKPEIKGDDGYTPIKGKDYFDGEKGEDYVLTEKDKEEIASKIKVPVVEKEIIVEKTEVIKEVPSEVDTNEIIEEVVKRIPVAEEKELDGSKIVDKINALPLTPDEKIDASHIKNLPYTMITGNGGVAVANDTYVKLDQTAPQSIINGYPINASEPSFTYTGGVLTQVDYPSGFNKVLAYNGDGTLDTITYSNGVIKTMVWSSGVLQSIEVT